MRYMCTHTTQNNVCTRLLRGENQYFNPEIPNIIFNLWSRPIQDPFINKY